MRPCCLHSLLLSDSHSVLPAVLRVCPPDGWVEISPSLSLFLSLSVSPSIPPSLTPLFSLPHLLDFDQKNAAATPVGWMTVPCPRRHTPPTFPLSLAAPHPFSFLFFLLLLFLPPSPPPPCIPKTASRLTAQCLFVLRRTFKTGARNTQINSNC